MTGEALTIRAAALFGETEIDDYKEIALTHINILLDDTWKQNNRMRLAAGKKELTARVSLGGLGEELPYEEALVHDALPYGLAAKLFFEEDDNPRLSMFNEEFANRLEECDVGVVDCGSAAEGRMPAWMW